MFNDSLSLDALSHKIIPNETGHHLKSIIMEGVWSISLPHPKHCAYDTSRRNG
jgi:hypothetical protein